MASESQSMAVHGIRIAVYGSPLQSMAVELELSSNIHPNLPRIAVHGSPWQVRNPSMASEEPVHVVRFVDHMVRFVDHIHRMVKLSYHTGQTQWMLFTCFI